MSDYYTPGGSNLTGHPHAPRMAVGQRKTFMANLRKGPSLQQLIEQQRQERAGLQDAGRALGFSCHGPYEDPLNCLDACEGCPFWQYDPPTPEHQSEGEYYTWVLEVAQAELSA